MHPIFSLPTSSCKNTVLCSHINTVDFIYSLHKKGGINLHAICLRNYLQDNHRKSLTSPRRHIVIRNSFSLMWIFYIDPKFQDL